MGIWSSCFSAKISQHNSIVTFNEVLLSQEINLQKKVSTLQVGLVCSHPDALYKWYTFLVHGGGGNNFKKIIVIQLINIHSFQLVC